MNSLSGCLQCSDRKLSGQNTGDFPARPFWACTYTTHPKGQCKGQATNYLGITVLYKRQLVLG